MGRKAVVFNPSRKVEVLQHVEQTGHLPADVAANTVFNNLPKKTYFRTVTLPKVTPGRGRPPVKLVLTSQARSYIKKTVKRLLERQD